jgi:hypothetical protein
MSYLLGARGAKCLGARRVSGAVFSATVEAVGDCGGSKCEDATDFAPLSPLLLARLPFGVPLD